MGEELKSRYNQHFTQAGQASLTTRQLLTFHGDVDSRGQKQASKAIVEDLVALQRGCGVVCDFNTWTRKRKSAPQRETVEIELCVYAFEDDFDIC